MTSADPRREYDSAGIMELLPHRPPMLLVDRLIDVVPGVSATGIKLVRPDEIFLQGHFPGKPVMPGVMIIEAMAQAAGAMAIAGQGPEDRNKLVLFTTLDNARFRKPVEPGDTLHLKVATRRKRHPFWQFAGEAFVGDSLCAEAEFGAMLMEPGRMAGKS